VLKNYIWNHNGFSSNLFITLKVDKIKTIQDRLISFSEDVDIGIFSLCAKFY